MLVDATDVELPKTLEEVDAAFMTAVLRRSGHIAPDDEVISQEEVPVGLAIGYFSAIKRLMCTFKKARVHDRFVVKTWPGFEALPHETIEAMFGREIQAYQKLSKDFFPRPKVHMAAFDAPNGRWAIVLDDVESFAVHKSHETEMTLDDVMRMVPKLVEIAVAWEGCDEDEKAAQLDAIGIAPWMSSTNLGSYKTSMPTGAKLFDKFTSMGGASVAGDPPWPESVGGPGIVEMLARRCDAFFANTLPANGATSTLVHGDLKGDNIFFCEPSAACPDGWLCIDFQMMYRGPIPSDLAYLMSTGSVLPEVYTGDNLQRVLRAFYDAFMAKTTRYKSYTYSQFVSEFATMTAVSIVYNLVVGTLFWIAGAFHNQTATRVELGDQGVTEADLTADELRQRMWWRKSLANARQMFRAFDQYAYLKSLPENQDQAGGWVELPDHLR